MTAKEHWQSYARSERGARQLGFMFSAGVLSLYAIILTGLMEYVGGVSWKPIYRATMPWSLIGYFILLALPVIVFWRNEKHTAARFFIVGFSLAVVYYATNYSAFARAATYETAVVWRAAMKLEIDPKPISLYRMLDVTLKQQRDDRQPWLGRMAPEYDKLEVTYGNTR